MIVSVLKEFGLTNETTSIMPLWQGLINHTWKITVNNDAYIFQKINHHVFRHPQDIAINLDLIAAFLKANHPEYLFVSPLLSVNGQSMIYKREEGFYRAFPFVTGSHSKDVVETPLQAYEAAKQFGKFTKLLKGINISKLKITIPSFHDLALRYNQFLTALQKGNKIRILECADMIEQLKKWVYIKNEYEEIIINPAFQLRVTHHDTKISNVLFDNDNKGLCVIDLDTAMPGYFISDVGDMMRTYLSPVSEEDSNFEKIEIRDDFYKAIVQGYYKEMKDELTAIETKSFFYSGTYMIYMQVLRFLTDYLDGDVYYGAKYPEQNFVRAKNQLVLLQRLLEKKEQLQNIFLG